MASTYQKIKAKILKDEDTLTTSVLRELTDPGNGTNIIIQFLTLFSVLPNSTDNLIVVKPAYIHTALRKYLSSKSIALDENYMRRQMGKCGLKSKRIGSTKLYIINGDHKLGELI